MASIITKILLLTFIINFLGQTIQFNYSEKLWYNDSILFSGDFKELWDNGQIKVRGNFQNGKKHGKWTEWHQNGQTKLKMQFLWDDTTDNFGTKWNGVPEGKIIEWYDNGNKKLEGQYKNGLAYGIFTEWYDNGQKEREENYENGFQEGESFVWGKDGKLITKIIYKKSNFYKIINY